MIIPVVAMLIALSVPLAGGDLGRLTGLRLRWMPTVLAALAVQVLLTTVWAGVLDHGVAAAVHLATYGLAAAFVWANRRVPGLPVVAAGGAANLAAIAANGGVMPASATALEVSGIAATAGDFANSAVVADARLAFLGDVFAVPAGWPLANVFSVGDVVLLAGLAWLLHATCRRRPSLPASWSLPPQPSS